MVWIPGGEFWMGSIDPDFSDARPLHRVYLDGFWIDQTEVTNAQFGRFVRATGCVTIAERPPDPKDFPGVPAERLFAGPFVFTAPDHPVSLKDNARWWSYVQGADWNHPEGRGSDILQRQDHPVVQVAWTDAMAYCQWDGERLPTGAEFEFAARGGLDRKRYPWGGDFTPGGKFMANTFQGHFPDAPKAEDGCPATHRWAHSLPRGYGLYDMAGNVWEWTSDWYRPAYYQTLAAAGPVARNPQGPSDSYDPDEPGVAKRVQRGGSFLCTAQCCGRYAVGSRGKGAIDTSPSA